MPNSASTKFQELAERGNTTGEVAAVNRSVIKLTGLDYAPVGAQVLFANGQRGMVQAVEDDFVSVIDLSAEALPIGTLAVLENEILQVPVGPELIGRMVSPFGEPLDGKGAINTKATGTVFADAPPISQRTALNQQLSSGVMIVDSMFPVLLGQRIAILGDYKTGKSTFLTQLVTNQTGTNRVVIYVMIAKRRADIDSLVEKLRSSRAMDYSIIVATSIFDSLGQSYLAPFAACAMAEELWKKGSDVIIIYDDLSNHAKVYRELSLLSGAVPARDSYPGDIFYTHSQLLERAGKLSTGPTLTCLPVVVTENDDITGYLSTNVMSMADGQIIFDKETYHSGIRPAVNIGLSVSRVGGRAQAGRGKDLTQALMKKIADWRQAKEFSQFSSELAVKTRDDLDLGNKIYEALRQTPDEHYSLEQQQLILETILSSSGHKLDVTTLKREAIRLAAGGGSHDQLKQQLLAKSLVQAGPAK